MAVTERLCTVQPAVAGVGRGLIAANHAVWKCMLHCPQAYNTAAQPQKQFLPISMAMSIAQSTKWHDAPQMHHNGKSRHRQPKQLYITMLTCRAQPFPIKDFLGTHCWDGLHAEAGNFESVSCMGLQPST